MEPKRFNLSEDWLSLWLGLFIFVLSLGVFGQPQVDLLGWGANTTVWKELSKSVAPVSKQYASVKGVITRIDGNTLTLRRPDGREDTVVVKQGQPGLKVGDNYERRGLSGMTSILCTYVFLMLIMGMGAKLLGADLKRFAAGFTFIFFVSYGCSLLGHYAHIAATKNQLKQFDISWAMSLTGEAGLIIALIAGLVIGNLFPRLSAALKTAARPELYIKTAIVIMGAMLGVKAADSLSLATNVMFLGLCAIVAAYLLYWAVVYFVARRFFKFSKEWSAPLASGISVCGVSAAIATGAAIRARPIVPVMVSSLVVIFAVVEMVFLPFLAQTMLWKEPLVAGAWMGLVVKTDGGAVASGAIADALIRAKALEMQGIRYQDGWMTMTATTVKMFIDIFIGIWAFLLAVIWCTRIERNEEQKVRATEIWRRFPKFVIGYALTFVLMLWICWPAVSAIGSADKQIKQLNSQISSMEKQYASAADPAIRTGIANNIKDIGESVTSLRQAMKIPQDTMAKARTSTQESNVFRVMFFMLTFFAIGLVSNFSKLREEGIGKLAAVYVICLFGFIIWVGLAISWVFFHGVKPPIVAG